MNTPLSWVGPLGALDPFPCALLLGLAALGMWLRLAPAGEGLRALGGLLAVTCVALLALAMPRFGSWLEEGVFWGTSGVAVLAAGAAITCRNAVYVAICFALSLLGTAGLFLFLGAQFLGVATVVIYAGAIVVTFLFLIMLAHPQGLTSYDRLSWARFAAPCAVLGGAVLTAILLLAPAESAGVAPRRPAAKSLPVTADQQHMARFGRELFTRHLVSVEVAGTLLLAALVGAVVIAAHGRTRGEWGAVPAAARPGDPRRPAGDPAGRSEP